MTDFNRDDIIRHHPNKHCKKYGGSYATSEITHDPKEVSEVGPPYNLMGSGATPEIFHDWRKRVKDHWYHSRLLQGFWPAGIRPHRKAVKELSELLGRRPSGRVRCRGTRAQRSRPVRAMPRRRARGR